MEAAETVSAGTDRPLPPISQPSASSSAASPERSDSFVLNRDTAKVHRTVIPRTAEPQLWVTVCGWPFATRKYSLLEDIPRGTHFSMICPRCCAFERSLAAGDDLSEVD